MSLPRGTVTFLFTDIVGSTLLSQRHGAAMQEAYARHDAILTSAITRHGGVRYKVIGDAYQAAFATAPAAVAAALEAQRALVAEDWAALGLPEPLRVRMALHVGAVDPDADGDYRSPVLNRLGRLLGAGHGGQILLSDAVRSLVRDQLSVGADLVDLGARRLRDLLEPEPIWQVTHLALPSDFPDLLTLDRRPHNIPTQPTPFIGREREVAAVVDLVRRDEVRLVTLTGPGGTGKTRLSLQVASELIDDFANGVWFVPLAPLTDPELVPSSIATALGLREDGAESPLEVLRRFLATRQLLLVLDNVEHLLAAAPTVGDLLAVVPRLMVLATSRSPLRLRAEHEHPVPALGLPRRRPPPTLEQMNQYEAVRLFIERAVAVKRDFTVTNETAPAVVEICHRLDGLPLAIELAAARIRILPPPAMLARLRQRLPLLTGGARDLPVRQQTLRNAIAWSDDILTDDERKLYRRLSVFAGGWTLEAADTVVGRPENGELGLDVLDGLERLVEHSLVRQEEGEDGSPRFTMLETIREYGLEQLAAHAEAGEAHERFARYCDTVAGEALAQLRGPEAARVLATIEREHDNVRAALSWAMRNDAALARHLAAIMGPFWRTRGHLSEGRMWLRHAMDAAGPTTDSDSARVGCWQGVFAYHQGEIETASTLLEAALATCREFDDGVGMATALHSLAWIALRRGGDLREAERLFSEEHAVSERVGYAGGVGDALSALGVCSSILDDVARASTLMEEGLRVHRACGDLMGASAAINNLGVLYQQQGELERARHAFEEQLSISRRLHEPTKIAIGLLNLGQIALDQQRISDALHVLAEGLALINLVGSTRETAVALENLSEVAAMERHPIVAARMRGAADGIMDVVGYPRNTTNRQRYERYVAMAKVQVSQDAWEASVAAGRALSLEQAVAEGLAFAAQVSADTE